MGSSLLILKGDKLPYRVVLRDGKEVFQTPVDCMECRNVLRLRNERGTVDARNFTEWADHFIQYVAS